MVVLSLISPKSSQVATRESSIEAICPVEPLPVEQQQIVGSVPIEAANPIRRRSSGVRARESSTPTTSPTSELSTVSCLMMLLLILILF